MYYSIFSLLLIKNHFDGDASQLGLWLALFALGNILGGVILGVWGGFKKKVVTAQTGLLTTVIVGLTKPDMFIIAGILCIMMGILGFFFPDVMSIENKSKEEGTNVAT